MEFPFSCNPAIEDISDACSDKECKRRDVLITQDQVADSWRSKNPKERERVGKIVDVFVRSIGIGGVFGGVGWKRSKSLE